MKEKCFVETESLFRVKVTSKLMCVICIRMLTVGSSVAARITVRLTACRFPNYYRPIATTASSLLTFPVHRTPSLLVPSCLKHWMMKYLQAIC